MRFCGSNEVDGLINAAAAAVKNPWRIHLCRALMTYPQTPNSPNRLRVA